LPHYYFKHLTAYDLFNVISMIKILKQGYKSSNKDKTVNNSSIQMNVPFKNTSYWLLFSQSQFSFQNSLLCTGKHSYI
jgi:hypothetical protein